MLKVEVVNLAPFQSAMAEKYPNAVKRGTGVGVRLFADVFAEDVRGAVPSKSGRTRSSIRSRMVNKLTAAVGYDQKIAWYARFVDLGTKPHPIYPKGRRGRKESIRVRRQFAKAERGARLNPDGSTTPLRTRWDRDYFRAEESRLGWLSVTGGGRSGKLKTAITVYGRLNRA